MKRVIELDFEFKDAKIITRVRLKPKKGEKSLPYDAIFDTGCSKTTMSKDLFNTLGYVAKKAQAVKIIGINGESDGFSTIIDNFTIGSENLGDVRITVTDMQEKFNNSIILWMNILMWFNTQIHYTKKKITLAERAAEGYTTTRFTRGDTNSIVLPSIQN